MVYNFSNRTFYWLAFIKRNSWPVIDRTRTPNIEETAIISLPSMSLIKRSSAEQMQARGGFRWFWKANRNETRHQDFCQCVFKENSKRTSGKMARFACAQNQFTIAWIIILRSEIKGVWLEQLIMHVCAFTGGLERWGAECAHQSVLTRYGNKNLPPLVTPYRTTNKLSRSLICAITSLGPREATAQIAQNVTNRERLAQRWQISTTCKQQCKQSRTKKNKQQQR